MCNTYKTYFFVLVYLVIFVPFNGQSQRSSPRIDLEQFEKYRLEKVILTSDVEVPIELDVAKSGKVFFIERKGRLKLFDPTSKKTSVVGEVDVAYVLENGLIGMTLDPNFETNHWIYLFYTRYFNFDRRNWGDSIQQYLSRFTIINNKLDKTSEKVILKVPIDWADHSGGSLAFDNKNNLYVTIGDNTWFTFYAAEDAKRSAANSRDLRGKVLRIHPESNGSYTIPEGNLFLQDGKEGRPEIFVMGCRNPYRVSLDGRAAIAYFSEVGPDASADSVGAGPRGYDEINQVKRAGNFGWPLFTGDNKPYQKKDSSGIIIYNDPLAPINDSKKNTGIKKLPPAQKPIIWYPYDQSKEFAMLGYGAKSAIVGPVYYDTNYSSLNHLPRYYDHCLFFADWCRSWLMVAHLDKNENIERVEQFFPNAHFDKPIDMTIGPDGNLYVLEYGAGEYETKGSRLTRIGYKRGNRAPVGKANSTVMSGHPPLRVTLSGKGSFDPDQYDSLTYTWRIGENVVLKGDNVDYTFSLPGVYKVKLVVKDKAGLTSTDVLNIQVGNSKPEVNIALANRIKFYKDTISYEIHVKDKEDKIIDVTKADIKQYFLAKGEIIKNGKIVSEQLLEGKKLVEKSDCRSCHSTTEEKQIGPGFKSIALKYDDYRPTQDKLIEKVLNGGQGVWGQRAMPSHKQMPKQEAEAMVKYILALDKPEKNGKSIPPKGTLVVQENWKNESSSIVVVASYRDNGSKELGSLLGSDTLKLINNRIYPTDFAESRDVKMDSLLVDIFDGGYVLLKNTDLTDVHSLTYRFAPGLGGRIEARLDSYEGPVIGTLDVPSVLGGFESGYKWYKDWSERTIPIAPTSGEHDIYFVFRNEKLHYYILHLAWLQFNLK